MAKPYRRTRNHHSRYRIDREVLSADRATQPLVTLDLRGRWVLSDPRKDERRRITPGAGRETKEGSDCGWKRRKREEKKKRTAK